MMKKIVIIKHFGDNCPYIFSVPDEVHLKENDMVLVQTRRGEQQGKCVCDSFTVDESPLKALMTKYGANEPLAPVIGVFKLIRFDDEVEHAYGYKWTWAGERKEGADNG